ncbi:unnamed protein product, partial [Mesorhabditis belari]|uniref:Uncharacterized protein n=1 Tax=Mesorhabditis belari TaxID=2138241 RepID=A0AAF3EQF9_9BILA
MSSSGSSVGERSHSSTQSCPKCSSGPYCIKCGFHGYENFYETASSYESRISHHSHHSKAPYFRVPQCRPPSQCPFHSCDVQQTTWPQFRRSEKTFLIIFSTTFLIENIVQWSFYNLPELGRPLEEQFSKDPLELIHTFFGTIILITYLFFWMFGVYSILLKIRRLLFVFIAYLVG